jgi:hypothetical protein
VKCIGKQTIRRHLVLGCHTEHRWRCLDDLYNSMLRERVLMSWKEWRLRESTSVCIRRGGGGVQGTRKCAAYAYTYTYDEDVKYRRV